MRIRFLSLLAGCLFFSFSITYSQTATPPLKSAAATAVVAVDASAPLLKKLPPALREQGLALLKESDEQSRIRMVRNLVSKSLTETTEFLLDVLETDASTKMREAIINQLGKSPHPQVRQSLMRSAVLDTDAGVAMLALDALRSQDNRSLLHLLERRMDMARRNGDEKQFRLLAREQERWVSLVQGTMLPTFMQLPPPSFSLKAADQSVRVLAFGDFGDGSAAQKQVASAMLQYHRKTPFDFAVTLGDNFYSKGMESPNDPRWKTWWDEMYDPLGIKFYATLGNHDWGFPDSPAAEVIYTQKSPSWRMPATYYTFTAGPVQFFALDTNIISEAQLIWLRDELKNSRARWKIVYGHHPVYSAGQHEDNNAKIDHLLPVLKDQADIYLAGHDHDMQHLKPEGSLHFFVAGSGGKLRPVEPGPRSLFAKSANGFAVVEAGLKELKVTFIGTDLSQLYQYALTKN